MYVILGIINKNKYLCKLKTIKIRNDMKKIYLLGLIGLIFAACSSNSDSVKFEKVYEDKENDVTLTFIADMNFGDGITDMLQDSIKKAVLGEEFAKYGTTKAVKKYAEASLKTFVETAESSAKGIKLFTKIESKIVYADENYVSYRRILTTNTSTTETKNIMTTCQNYVFDVKTGRHLKEKDVFTPQQMNMMRVKLVENAKERAHAKGEKYDLRRIRPNGNFAMMDSCVVYTFNPYEIAHPRFGFIELRVKNEELRMEN